MTRRRTRSGAALSRAILPILLLSLLSSGCAFHLVCTRTTSVLEPIYAVATAEPAIRPQGLTAAQAEFILNLFKVAPLVEWFTDKPVKEKAIEAAIAAGVPVKYTTTRESSWFVFTTGGGKSGPKGAGK